VRRDGEYGHAHGAERDAREQLAAEDRAAPDRGHEHARERAVTALVEDARDTELHGEEEEEHGHAGRVERSDVELTAASWRCPRA
jgi:hypothetical protein